ncbi:MAG: kinase [Nocardioides sp.]|nr:kinase [Nocardioides sp.]
MGLHPGEVVCVGIVAAVRVRGVDTVPVLYLTVGLPGAGKTTLARRIADEHGVLRLTPDEWMAPLFGHSDADGRRDILEGRMIWVAHQVLVSGSSVILDFGCWSPEERFAIRSVAESVGARFDLRYVKIDEPERRARAARRWQEAPESTFAMSDADHDRFLALCQPPSSAELTYADIPEPPSGFENWLHWASSRWPTLPRLDLGAQ